jgi:O-antigen ligase
MCQGKMQNIGLDRLRTWLTADDSRLALGTAVGVAVLVGLVTGAMFGTLGPALALGAVGGLAVGLLMLRSIRWGLFALIGLICLLPYGAIPIDVGFRPTFIDVVLLALFGVWFVRKTGRSEGWKGGELEGWKTGRVEDWKTGRSAHSPNLPTFQPSSLPAFRPSTLPAFHLLIFAFLLWALITFIAGLAHAPLSATVLRRFAEVLLSVSLFFVIVNQVRRIKGLEQITAVIILSGGLTGFLGVFFYVLPGPLTVRILSKLAVFNYPAGPGILRFVEDDPSQPMRAIATSIDPNALGGLLVIVTTVAVVQLFADHPVLPRRLLAPLAGLMGLSLVLTFSRGSMLGLGAALLLVGVLRYRKLLLLIALVVILMLLLPQTQAYVTRFIQGIQGQDLATQMRFGEYKDAFTLISRYPVLGVGFSGTPDIDLYLGVSDLYLLIAEQMGLVGLLIFLVIAGTYFVVTYRAWRQTTRGHAIKGPVLPVLPAPARPACTCRHGTLARVAEPGRAGGSRSRDPARAWRGTGQRAGGAQAQVAGPGSKAEGHLLAYQTALAGALVDGVFDHFFFNINFVHLVALFWLVMGLGVAAARIAQSEVGRE